MVESVPDLALPVATLLPSGECERVAGKACLSGAPSQVTFLGTHHMLRCLAGSPVEMLGRPSLGKGELSAWLLETAGSGPYCEAGLWGSPVKQARAWVESPGEEGDLASPVSPVKFPML